jgi:hypothetical protein
MAEPVQGNAQAGSAENGGQQPGNADLLTTAFAGAGGAKPEAKPEGGAAQGGTAPAGESTKLAPWAEQLPEDIRGNAELAGRLAKFSKIGDLAKAYLEAEGKGAIPGEGAAAEDVAAFWKKAGKPDTPEGYAFAKEQGGAAIAAAAHAANLTAGQAAALYQALTGQAGKQLEAVRAEQNRQMQETSAALQKEFGEAYPAKIQLLSRGLAAAGPNVANLLAGAGLAGNAEIVKAMIAFGQMTGESGSARGSVAPQPITSVKDGGWYSYKNE